MTDSTSNLRVHSIGDYSQTQVVNGISFYCCSYTPDRSKPHRVRSHYRIGSTKVPAWLYVLVLNQARQLQTRNSAPPGNMTLTRGADGIITDAQRRQTFPMNAIPKLPMVRLPASMGEEMLKQISRMNPHLMVVVELGNVVMNPASPGYIPGTLEAMGLEPGPVV